MDLHAGLRCGYRSHHFERSIIVRHYQTHRRSHFESSKEEDGIVANGTRRIVKKRNDNIRRGMEEAIFQLDVRGDQLEKSLVEPTIHIKRTSAQPENHVKR